MVSDQQRRSCSVEVLVFDTTTPTPPPTIPTPTYYVNATIDDNALTFNNNITDSTAKSTSTINGETTYTTTLTITGINTSTMYASYVIVLTNQLNAIATGTYTNTDAANIANCTYTDGSGNEYVTGTSQPFTVTVTSVTSSAISGTFSGTLISPADATKTITVTNGSFNVPSQ